VFHLCGSIAYHILNHALAWRAIWQKQQNASNISRHRARQNSKRGKTCATPPPLAANGATVQRVARLANDGGSPVGPTAEAAAAWQT